MPPGSLLVLWSTYEHALPVYRFVCRFLFWSQYRNRATIHTVVACASCLAPMWTK